MEITKKITVNLAGRRITEVIDVVQCDSNTRVVEVVLLNGEDTWSPPEGVTASVAFEKPDDTSGWYDTLPTGVAACTVSGNTIRAVLAPEVLTAAGRVTAAVVLMDASLNRLSTFPFILSVHKSPAAGKTVSNNYYALKTLQEINDAMDAIRAELAQLEQGGGGAAEGSVLYTEQTLTDEQKAQARENIGAVSAEYFNFEVKSKNQFDGVFDESGYIDTTTGEDVDGIYRKRTGFRPIGDGSNAPIYAARSGGAQNVAVLLYDADKNYLGYLNFAETSEKIKTADYAITIKGIAYFRLYASVDNVDGKIYVSTVDPGSYDAVEYEYEYGTKTDAILYTKQSLTKEQKQQARENIGAASSSDLEMEIWEQCEGELQTGLLSWGGTIEAKYAKWATRIVEIEDGATYRITACVSESVQMVQFHDADGNVIERIEAEKPASGTYQKYTDYAVEVPSGAATIYVCSNFDLDAVALADLQTYPIIEKCHPLSVKEAVEQLMNNAETESNSTPLTGKVIVNFGDSIFGKRRPPEDISTELARLTGATVHNCGFGGCRMAMHPMTNYGAFSMYKLADAIVSGDWTEQDAAIADTTQAEAVPSYFAEGVAILKGLDFSKVDIVTIAYGTNDFMGGISLENANNAKDTNTFAGALRYSVEKLLTAYPHLKIFVCSQTYRFWMDASNAFTEDSDTKTNGNGVKLTDFVEKTEEVAKAYHLPYINNYDIGMNKYNRSQYFPATDGTHPLTTGCHLIAAHIAKELF